MPSCCGHRGLRCLPGHAVVIICSLAIELSNVAGAQYMASYTHRLSRILMFVFLGLIFFSFPLLGYLADVRFTRYRILKWSFIFVITGAVITLLYSLASIGVMVSLHNEDYSAGVNSKFTFVLGVGISSVFIGMGLFEANAIQFGLDQLLEAPTSKLISYIHWFYWSQNVAHLVEYYALVGFLAVGDCTVKKVIQRDLLEKIVLSIALIVILGATASGLVLFCGLKQHLYIQRAGLNPFKNIYKVLKYSWEHKVPERRSAYTYWEEDIPLRIDLGKKKYGGPFDNEEVEDTKTFLRFLPLLLCLFGYHIAGDGYTSLEQLQKSSCPSLPVLLLIVANPLHMSGVVIVVGIPLYRLLIKRIFPCFGRIRMLTRIWFGLYLSLLQICFYITVVLNHDDAYWQKHHSASSISAHDHHFRFSVIHKCFKIRVGINHHNTCKTFNDPIDNTYLWFIIPQLLNGLSALLVSMTVLEFISAQAPQTTKGLLIGLWYATSSIKYAIVDVLGEIITVKETWLIYEGAKGFLILLSLILFSCVSKCYRYRQRDEIVNVQGMIEDTFEKWFDQEAEYKEECRKFYQDNKVHIPVYNSVSFP